MENLKIGLVGVGQIGNSHLNKYQSIPSADIVAVADIDEEKRKAVSKKFDIGSVYADYRDLLKDSEVEAVDVCLHNNLHAPVVIDALQAGKDVFCEKPMAGSYQDATEMYDVAGSTGNELDVQNNQLYAKEARVAKKLIDDGKLGDLYYGKVASFQGAGCRRRAIPYIDGYGSPNFVQKERSGGGALYDLATYTIGQVMYLMGVPDVERITGKTFQNARELHEDGDNIYKRRIEETGYDVEDVGFGFVELEDGKVISLTSSWHIYLDSGGNAVVGTKGGVVLEPFKYYTTISDVEADVSMNLDEYERRQHLLRDETDLLHEDLASEPLYHWVESLNGNEKRIPTDEIALKTMMIMEGIYLSEELGREVTAEEVREKSESTAVDL